MMKQQKKSCIRQHLLSNSAIDIRMSIFRLLCILIISVLSCCFVYADEMYRLRVRPDSSSTLTFRPIHIKGADVGDYVLVINTTDDILKDSLVFDVSRKDVGSIMRNRDAYKVDSAKRRILIAVKPIEKLNEGLASTSQLDTNDKFTLFLITNNSVSAEFLIKFSAFKEKQYCVIVDSPDTELSSEEQPSLTEEDFYNRGLQYYTGEGVEQNYNIALILFERAARSGHAFAQYYLGLIYETGKGGIKKQPFLAREWYRKSAGLGNLNAKAALERLKRGERRPLGISVGYTARQLRTPDGSFPWCGIGDLARSSSPAWTVGLYWAPEFKYGLGIQTGVYADFATCTYDDISLFDCNLSVPLRVQYRYAILSNLSVFVFTGPGFDMGLAYNVDMDGHPEDGFSLYDTADISRFNLTWGIGAGLRWNGLQIMFTSDWGLLNVLKDSKDRVRLNKPFGVSIAYNFKLK